MAKNQIDNKVPDFVDKLLNQAVANGSSDIYLLPQRECLKLRMRINGIQKDIDTVDAAFGSQCTARVKVLAKLLTYRTRIPQDGSFQFAGSEFRVAVMPTIHGERITIRVMNGGAAPRTIKELGFSEEVTGILRLMLLPTGLIILTGPTGCGKTTTVYAMLRELLNDDQDPSSIITVEDPVECELPGISQCELKRSDESEDDFAFWETALKSALRQDVKTLVIGEMRDKAVVRIALEAALTGHRVISTYHAGDIASVYARVMHQGFEPFLVAAAIKGIVSQRLFHTRDHGIVPIAACLQPDDAWRDFIMTRPGLDQLRKHIKGVKTADLEYQAMLAAEQGFITKEQVKLL
jgi:type II secretory ATPase GspE/PulE/Tfp pilus assembly ATPase PilB-like protein